MRRTVLLAATALVASSAFGQAAVVLHASGTINPGVVVSDETRFDDSALSAILSLRSGTLNLHHRMDCRTGDTTFYGQSDKFLISALPNGTAYHATVDASAPIGTITSVSPVTGVGTISAPAGGNFTSFTPYTYNKTLFGNFRTGYLTAPDGNNLWHSTLGAGAWIPIAGYTSIRPRAMDRFGDTVIAQNRGNTSAADVCEHVRVNNVGTATFSTLPMADVYDCSDTGNTILGRTTTQNVIYRMNTSTSTVLNISGLNNPYFAGISPDGTVAYGGDIAPGGNEPSTGFFWRSNGVRVDATTYLSSEFGIAGLTVRHVLDVSRDRRRLLLITGTAAARRVTIVKLPRPILAPLVKYITFQEIVMGSASSSTIPLGINREGSICGYYTEPGGLREPFIHLFNGTGYIGWGANDGLAGVIDTSSIAYGTASNFTQAAKFQVGLGTVPVGSSGFFRSIEDVTSNGSIWAGISGISGVNIQSAAVWTASNSTSIERPYGTTSVSALTSITEDGFFLGGQSLNTPVFTRRNAVNNYTSIPAPVTPGSFGRIDQVEMCGTFGSVYGGGFEATTTGATAGIPVVWRLDRTTLAVTRTPVGTGPSEYIHALQGTNHTGPGLPAGFAAFKSSGFWSAEYGTVPYSDITMDSSIQPMNRVSALAVNGKATGYFSNLKGFVANPFVPLVFKFNLAGWTQPMYYQPRGYATIRPFYGERYTPPSFLTDLSPEGMGEVQVTATGTADFIFKYPHSLSEDEWDVFVSPVTGIPELTINLINGDANDDDEIGPGDLQVVLDNFGNTIPVGPSFGPYPDLDGDGECGPGDLQIVLDNFGRQGVL